MKSEGFNAHIKLKILKHALKENNISYTCKLFGISRTAYYSWSRAYQKYGMMGLENKEPKKPEMPNKVNKTIEREILSYVGRYPTDGPKRIYYELQTEGIDIGESGIYNVLKRHNLSKKAQRIEYSKKRISNFKGKSKIKKTTPCFEKKQGTHPGHMVIQRMDFIGTFEGIGPIYQYTMYDTYSKWVIIKLYNKKQDIDIWYYFELKLVYLMKNLNLNIENLITEKRKEFLPYLVKGNKHKEVIGNFNINHSFIIPENNEMLEDMNDFNEFLVKEFYNKVGRDKNLDSFIKVERALNKFLRSYNSSKVILNGCNAGKVPSQVILEKAAENNVDIDTLPLWLLTLLNPSKGSDWNE